MSKTGKLAVDFDDTLTAENVAYWDGERPEPDHEVVDDKALRPGEFVAGAELPER